MSPRRDRWLSMREVAELLEKTHSRLHKLSRKRRLEYVRRVIRRAERRDCERYTRRVGRDLYLSRNALETLLPWDADSLTNIERNVSELAQKQRDLKRQLNGHGSRINSLEEKHRLTTEYLAALQRVDGRNSAA